MALLECVPNFSEGRDPEIIRQIAAAISEVPGVYLLDIDPGKGANRTVMTFAGTPQAVVEAAFQGIQKASVLIDMTRHHGAHPRIGATDVCPLVPIEGISMADTIQLAHTLGERVGRELQIPVFLYEEAAKTPERRNLANIRTGEYEELPAKLATPLWKPDYGPASCNIHAGATVIGARHFLVAYNVNLSTASVPIARAIAADVRETGRVIRDPAHDTEVHIPGRCPSLKAIGWYIEEYGLAQVSMNLTNLSRTTLHEAFEACCTAAALHGVRVTGSELIGMIPRKALLDAGKYYSSKQPGVHDVSEEKLMELAVQKLGLDALRPFQLRKKVLEYKLEDIAAG